MVLNLLQVLMNSYVLNVRCQCAGFYNAGTAFKPQNNPSVVCLRDLRTFLYGKPAWRKVNKHLGFLMGAFAKKRCARKAELFSWFSKWHALDICFRVCLRKQFVLHVDGVCLCLCSIYDLELFLSHVKNHTSLCNDHGSPGWLGSVYSWSLSKQHLSDFTFW